MDHKAFLASLTPEQRTDLTARDDHPALKHLTLHWALILFFGLYIGFQLPLWGIFLIPQGILIAFCFTLLHETIHAKAISKPVVKQFMWSGLLINDRFADGLVSVFSSGTP